jgi:hypothetical protein
VLDVFRSGAGSFDCFFRSEREARRQTLSAPSVAHLFRTGQLELLPCQH